MTYGVISESVERHCVNLICLLNCHSMKYSLLLLLPLVLNHFFHYPRKANIDSCKSALLVDGRLTFCEGVLRAEPLSLCGLWLLSL